MKTMQLILHLPAGSYFLLSPVCVRHHVSLPGITLDDAVERAVNECIAKGILADSLRRNKAEAMSISIFEYNEAEEKEKIRKAEYKVGYDAGIADAKTQDVQAYIADSIEEGLSEETISSKLIKIFHLPLEEAHNQLMKHKKQ